MSLLGLVLLMALVLVVFSVLTLMSRIATALEHIEEMVEQLLRPAGEHAEDMPGDVSRR